MNSIAKFKKDKFKSLTENKIFIGLLTTIFYCVKFKVKVYVAESCTGGQLSSALSKLPGSSLWFELGVVSYSNNSKSRLLDVNENSLMQDGAVSSLVAKEMVKGLSKLDNTKNGVYISITGIAGPTGSTSDKAIGLVYFCCFKDQFLIQTEQRFSGNRTTIQKLAVFWALQCIRNVVATSCIKNNL